MGAFASTDVTVTAKATDKHILGKIKMQKATIVFGDGALTYTTGGVPMPDKAYFGMNKEIIGMTFLEGVGASGNGFVYKYDITNNKMLIYFADYDAGADGALIQYTSGGTPAAATLIVSVWGK